MPAILEPIIDGAVVAGNTWRSVVGRDALLAKFQECTPAFGISGFRKVTWAEPLAPLVTARQRTKRIPDIAEDNDHAQTKRHPDIGRRGFSPGVRILGGTALYPAINEIEFRIYQELTRSGIPSVNVFAHMAAQRARGQTDWTTLMAAYHRSWALLRERDIWLFAVGETLWHNAWGLQARRGHPTDQLFIPQGLREVIRTQSQKVWRGLVDDLAALRSIVDSRHPMLDWSAAWSGLEAWLTVPPSEANNWNELVGLNGKDFQDAVAYLLQRTGYPETTIIGGPHDGGVDIRVPDPRSGRMWGVQTKLRTSGAVSATAVEEVVHGCRIRGNWHPWLIISTPQATDAVREACQRHGVRLWTGDDIARAAEAVAWSPSELLSIGRA